jgi:hypothetical protein
LVADHEFDIGSMSGEGDGQQCAGDKREFHDVSLRKKKTA